jgi:heme ABC exporter ATP-binding subunit CcmA
MAPAVHFRSVVTLLGRFPALAGMDLDVLEGEVLLVEGPNGAGKTTLLRTCAGLVPVSSGDAAVLGHDLRADRSGLRRSVALLGHAGFLYEELTVRENLRFWARAGGASAAAADEALDRLGLGGRLASVRAGRLSAGQRRRAALAAVVVRDRRLWLLDEPHAGLDADGRDVLDRLIAEAASRGTTVLIASHEGDRVAAQTTRRITVAGGRVAADSGSSAARPAQTDGTPAQPEPVRVA